MAKKAKQKPVLRGIPLAAMDRILRKSGAPRVSESGKKALRDALEDVAAEISKQAMEFAEHAGRKTVKAEDIRLATK